MRIVAVKYVEDRFLAGLELAINNMIADGWQPIGTMVSYDNYGTQTFAREMVRYADNVAL